MKHFSNLLLLETKDWDEKGGYLPNQGKVYDFHLVVRIKNSPEDVMKKNRIFHSDNIIEKDSLWRKFRDNTFEYDIPGYIRKSELVTIIENEHIIFQGDRLNGATLMDASNYYCQVGDIHRSIDDLVAELK